MDSQREGKRVLNPNDLRHVERKYNPDDFRQNDLYTIGCDPVSTNRRAVELEDGKEPVYFYNARVSETPMRKIGFKNFWIRKLNFNVYGRKQYDFNVYFGFGLFTKGLFWFRFNHNNKGFHVKNTKLHSLIFSERMGIKGSGKTIGNWHFKWLKRYEG